MSVINTPLPPFQLGCISSPCRPPLLSVRCSGCPTSYWVVDAVAGQFRFRSYGKYCSQRYKFPEQTGYSFRNVVRLECVAVDANEWAFKMKFKRRGPGQYSGRPRRMRYTEIPRIHCSWTPPVIYKHADPASIGLEFSDYFCRPPLPKPRFFNCPTNSSSTSSPVSPPALFSTSHSLAAVFTTSLSNRCFASHTFHQAPIHPAPELLGTQGSELTDVSVSQCPG